MSHKSRKPGNRQQRFQEMHASAQRVVEEQKEKPPIAAFERFPKPKVAYPSTSVKSKYGIGYAMEVLGIAVFFGALFYGVYRGFIS